MESIVIACLYLKKNLDFPFKKWKTKITECLQILNGEVIIQTKKKKKALKFWSNGISWDFPKIFIKETIMCTLYSLLV